MFNFLCGDPYCEGAERFFTDYQFFDIPPIKRDYDDPLYFHLKLLVETNEVPGVRFGDLLMDGDAVLFSANLVEDARAGVGSCDWIWFQATITALGPFVLS